MNLMNRIFALDVFRGLAIFIIILVDAPPANIYEILQHAQWEGLTIADLAFPAFVFAMGMSAAVSSSRKVITWKKILIRAGFLFLIGVFLNALTFTDFEHFRVFGILQRLALIYLLGMSIVKIFHDERLILLAALMLLIISSAGFHLYSENPFDEMHNISGAIDLIFLGVNHMYTPTHDPEGLYGTISSTASMLFGFLAGRILIDELPKRDKILRLLIFGAILLAMGVAWSCFDIISKKIWTAPFALLNVSGDAILFAMLLHAGKTFQPLAALGKNPLLMFVASNIAIIFLSGAGLWEEIFWRTRIEFISVEFNVLIFCLIWAALWILAAEILDRLGIVIKL